MDLSVLKGISLDVPEGEYVALMGTSGSGKTTLMNVLGSLDYPTNGIYRLAGIDVSTLSASGLAEFRSRYIGFVFQNFNLLPRTSALDNVLLPTLYAADGRTKRERVEYARELLEIVGLSGRLDHTPNQLSGGERQRVAIARALINRPKLLLADEPTGNLDSRTESEILGVFRRLNEKRRITLVVVTHDEAVASQADRIIHLKDGVIADDTSPTTAGESSLAEESQSLNGYAGATNLATFTNAILVAALALKRNLLRTMLTMLGVIIGVASVVTVMELSNGATRAIEDTVASMGASTLTVTPTNESNSGKHRRQVLLTPDDVRALSKGCPATRIAAPLIGVRIQLVRGNRRWLPTFVFGTSPDYLTARNWNELELGQSFSQRDIDDAAKVCVIGRTVANMMFDEDYPIGQELRANGTNLRVVGILSAKGGDVIGNDQDDIVILPWTTLKFRVYSTSNSPRRVSTFADQMPELQLTSRQISSRAHIHQILVQAQSPQQVSEARDQIKRVLANRHDVDADVFQVNDMTEVSRITQQVVRGLSALGLVIAGVSLLVGGVGIMNIMLVSVTERTREIGLRMAIGASGRAILRQFLIEATVLCLVGGLVGIVIGHCSSTAVGWILGWPTVMSIWVPVVAVGVATTVGVVFGYYPARKASMLNPIDALRYE